MKVTDKQLQMLEKLGEEALEDPGVIQLHLQDSVIAIIEEVRRLHKIDGEFSKSLVREMLESFPYDLPLFQYLSKVRSGKLTDP